VSRARWLSGEEIRRKPFTFIANPKVDAASGGSPRKICLRQSKLNLQHSDVVGGAVNYGIASTSETYLEMTAAMAVPKDWNKLCIGGPVPCALDRLAGRWRRAPLAEAVTPAPGSRSTIRTWRPKNGLRDRAVRGARTSRHLEQCAEM
jgi:hypothetical protein